MEYIIIILLLTLVVSIYATLNLLKKNESYEDTIEELQKQVVELETFVQQFSDNLTAIDNQLKQIDTRGSFASDDETGFVFKTIQLIMNDFQKFNINSYAKEEKG